jgi:hypothetical protein
MFPSGSLVDRMMNFVKPWLTFIESRSDWHRYDGSTSAGGILGFFLKPFLIPTVTLALSACFMPESHVRARGLKPSTTQKAEFVFERSCMEAIEPREGFELHVPLDDKGVPVDDETYSTGVLDFKIKDPHCGIIHVGHPAIRKDKDFSSSKQPCCDSGR